MRNYIKLKNVLTMSGLAGLKARSKEILTNPDFKLQLLFSRQTALTPSFTGKNKTKIDSRLLKNSKGNCHG